RNFNVPEDNFAIDLTIARGLDYYTGTVYETFLNDYPEIGSICSGGRYENLAEFYTKQKLPGVGISIGLTRLFYQLREAGIIKTDDVPSTPSQVLLVPMEESHNTYCIQIRNSLRKYGIVSEIYFDEAKIGKKLSYANKQDMPFAILIGEDEVKNKSLTLKDMKSGDQDMMSIEEAVNRIKPNVLKME
ncbi:MAG TPA: histidine--tRNA ligase, partial [Thermoanaerobacterales bacterium]|nr:histidine--tRNA ligase [Thermoanaerobacterales bacterium]